MRLPPPPGANKLDGPFALRIDGETTFTNCLGKDERAIRFLSSIVTKNRREAFLDQSEWVPSFDLVSLAYLWNHPRKSEGHYFRTLWMVNEIISRELKCNDPVECIKTRGWSVVPDKKSGTYVLRYRRLEICLEDNPNVDSSTNYTRNLLAMTHALCSILGNQVGYTNPHDKSATTPFGCCSKSTFINLVNQCAHQLHFSIVITEHYFLPFATAMKNDVRCWAWKVFKGTLNRAEFTKFVQAFFTLMPLDNSPGDGEIQRDLVTNHTKGLKDEVFRLAKLLEHKVHYRERVEQQLKNNFRRASRKAAIRSNLKNLPILRSRARDNTYEFMSASEKQKFRSITRLQKSTSLSGKGLTGECFHCYCPRFMQCCRRPLANVYCFSVLFFTRISCTRSSPQEEH